MNISREDIDLLAEHSRYIFGRSPSAGGSGSSGPDTAIGVLHGLRACLANAFGTADLDGRVVLVQGVGSGGQTLVELLLAGGAKVIASDPATERVRELVARFEDVAVVAPDEAIATECDVFAPCAVGGVLNAESIPKLRCRIVAGSANNQLATPEDAERLRVAGILYAPDYVISVDGGLHLYGLEQLGWDRSTLDRNLERIGETLTAIFAIADRDGITTVAAAERIGAQRLAEAQSSQPARD
jgi:glutamate dehydrogenase/leucine dehydrogenase